MNAPPCSRPRKGRSATSSWRWSCPRTREPAPALDDACRPDGARRRHDRRREQRTSRRPSRHWTRSASTHASARCPPISVRSTFSRSASSKASSAWSGPSHYSPTRSPTQTSRRSRLSSRDFTSSVGAHELAAERVEFALALAESFRLPEQLSQALNTKAVLLEFQGRLEEAMALVRHALQGGSRQRPVGSGSARVQQPRGPSSSETTGTRKPGSW